MGNAFLWIWVRVSRRDVWIMLGLFAIPFLLFLPFETRNDVFPFPRSGLGTDFLSIQWSNGVFVSRTIWKEGHLPVWRPLIMAGTPFVGNPTSLMFYPPYWLVLFLPVARAVTILLVAHLGILSAGTYAFARHCLTLDRWAAAIAALSFGLSYEFLSHVAGGHLGVISAVAWLPWMFGAVHGYFPRVNVRWIALTGGLLALSFLSHPPTALVNGLGTALYACFLWGRVLLRTERKHRWSRFWQGSALVLAPVLAFMIASVQAIPMIVLMSSISRASLSMAEASQYSLPAVLLPTMLAPTPLQFPEWSIYLGVAVIALAPAALLSKRLSCMTWFSAILALVFGVLSLGDQTPLFILAYKLVPGVSWLRVPSRFWFLTLFGTALLTGEGCDAIGGSRMINWRALRGVWIALVGVYVTGSVLMLAFVPAWRYEALGVACVVLPILLWYLLCSRGRATNKWMSSYRSLAVPLLLALLVSAAWQIGMLMEPMSIQQFVEPTPVVAFLGQQPGIFRVYGIRGTVPSPAATEGNLERLGGAEPFHPAYLANMINRATGCQETGYSAVLPGCVSGAADRDAYLRAEPNVALLGLLNVRYVVAQHRIDSTGLKPVADFGGQRVYENLYALPRAFVVSQARVLGDQDQVWGALDQIDPARTALVADPIPGELKYDIPPKEAEVLAYTSGMLTVKVALDRPGMLIVGQTWAQGWRATDNGNSVPLYRVDYALQGVYLDAGEHVVQLVYRPKSGHWGLAITVCGLVVLACCTALSGRGQGGGL